MVTFIMLQPCYIYRLLWYMRYEYGVAEFDTSLEHITEFLVDVSRVSAPHTEAWVHALGVSDINRAGHIEHCLTHESLSVACACLVPHLDDLMAMMFLPTPIRDLEENVYTVCNFNPNMLHVVEPKQMEAQGMSREAIKSAFHATVTLCNKALVCASEALKRMDSKNPLYRVAIAWTEIIRDSSFEGSSGINAEWGPVGVLFCKHIFPAMLTYAPQWLGE